MDAKLHVAIGSDPVFIPAYYGGHWIGVPLFFLPDGAFDAETGALHHIKVTILNDEIAKPLERRDSSLGWSHLIDSVSAFLVPWLVPIKELKELCKRYDIPIYWVTGIPRKFRKKPEGLRRLDRKCIQLSTEEWEKFIRHLRTISKTSALIAEIIWFLNTQLAEGGGFVTLESVLRLTTEDVSPEKKCKPNWIRLIRESFSCPLLIVHYLPDALWSRLCRQIRPHFLFVFSNKYGAPLLSNQIEKHFKTAGHSAGIKQEITPLCLRPKFNKEGVDLSVRRATGQSAMHPVTKEEWEMLCLRIPSLIERRGCKNTHEPMHMLNAIFYHFRERCAFRQLPRTFPPWRAVSSQYRRWQKKGIIDQIINLRKEIGTEAALSKTS